MAEEKAPPRKGIAGPAFVILFCAGVLAAIVVPNALKNNNNKLERAVTEAELEQIKNGLVLDENNKKLINYNGKHVLNAHYDPVIGEPVVTPYVPPKEDKYSEKNQ